MKLTINDISNFSVYDNKVTLDKEPGVCYFVMNLMTDGSGLFDIKPISGVRMDIGLRQPGPGFFFSLADFSDEYSECVMVFHSKHNLIGAYFKK